MMNTSADISDWMVRRHDSAARPQAVLSWAHDLDDDQGDMFWEVVADNWSAFDRIPHADYADLFSRFSGAWQAPSAVLSLPDTMTVYRGQNADAGGGLSWSLNRSVAERFARGHRGASNPNPVVLTSTIHRSEIALYLTDRSEAEIVLFDLIEGEV